MGTCFFWIGINVDEQLKHFHNRLHTFEKEFKINESNTTLSFHISLKMPFPYFSVALHEYDRDHAFHSTLFMDDNAGNCHRIYEALLSDYIPSTLTAERFQICLSDTGEPGSFRIIREIIV